MGCSGYDSLTNTCQSTLEPETQENILALLEEYNGSITGVSSWGELAKNVIGNPSKSKEYKAKKDFLITALKERGLIGLLPREMRV